MTFFLYSRSSGIECWPRGDLERIATEGTGGIELSIKGDTGHITDVVFENVSMTNFTYGIRAVADPEFDWGISDIKIRGYRPMQNHRQLYIDSEYAHNWDVQNLNITAMGEDQGGVEIVNAGKPSGYTGMLGKLKFLQLNCSGSFDRDAPPAFCMQVEKHGGLYLRQVHHEGTPESIKVLDISGRSAPNTNPDPIVIEAGVASGKFYDTSMNLYLIGNGIVAAPETAQKGLDDARLRFFEDGLGSTVVDCGDIHWDLTDADGNPDDDPAWEDFKMIFTHSERNRGSFFAKTGDVNYIKPHTICPSEVSGLTNINEVGGDLFDNGVMPTEAAADNLKQYATTNVITTANLSTVCPSGIADCIEDLTDYNDGTPDHGGSVYLDGSFTANRTINIQRGTQIIGAPNAELILGVADVPLLKIHVPVPTDPAPYRASGIVIRNLKLKTTQTGTAGTMTGIAMIGENSASVGVASDIHFSGLTIEGFETGLYGGPYDPTKGQPMLDGITLKNMSFVNNSIAAVSILSGNASNWNVLGLNMQSTSTTAVGWSQIFGGHQGIQGLTCQGSGPSNKMTDCIKVAMARNFYLTGLKKTQNVTNALTVGANGSPFTGIYEAPHLMTMVVRNNDFTSTASDNGRVNLLGKSFVTSMNNKYQYFNAESTYKGTDSRVTYCGDTYPGGTHYPNLNDRHPNLWTWVPTPTRVACGTRPIPWEDAVRFGGTSVDRPLVGTFYDDVREDFVIYREGTTGVPQSKFLIMETSGVFSQTIDWGLKNDLPMVSRFFPYSRAQIVIFRPSTGYWWVKDPNNSANNSAWAWGVSGDVPFVGNFFDESGLVTGNHDEAAVYRPSNKTFYIINPRTGVWTSHTTTPDNDSKIQVGDFLGVGYDQIAQFKAGTWYIINPRNNNTYTLSWGTTGDVPVAGKYLSGSCAQVAVWRPADQTFYVADPFSGCGTRSTTMIWGSNNDFLSTSYDDDIPLTINTADGSLRRPTAYRPTVGAFPYSIANGQWWVHDPF